MLNMQINSFEDGHAINGDCTDPAIITEIKSLLGDDLASLVATDPPYGNVINEKWDKWRDGQRTFVDWMMEWTNSYSNLLIPGGAMYVWGGYGVPGFRPFFEYASRVEDDTPMKIANLITWSKKRAYGVQKNYLATREEILYMIKGSVKTTATFNIPLLTNKRGYAGYNTKYPAKSEFYRRTNVWTDVTEIFRGKVHPTQKPLRVVEIPIEVNTNPGDWVIDPFAGSLSTAIAARKLGRKWICVEKDTSIYNAAIASLTSGAQRKR